MSIPSVEDLYSSYEKLSDQSLELSQRSIAFDVIIRGIKGNESTKRLASQFISRFSKQFESRLEESFRCLLDLCDDEDSNVRKQAIHDLLLFSKQSRSFVPRTADVLVQLFQTDDKKECNVISIVLTQLLHIELKLTLVGVFTRLLAMNSENSRENCLRFLADRLKTLSEDILTAELEEFIVEQVNYILQDVSEDEFKLAIALLSSLKCMSTLIGRQKLVGMITHQVLQAVPVFNSLDSVCLAQVRESCKQAVLCISKNVNAHELYIYLIEKVWSEIPNFTEGMYDERLSLLRLTAELLTFPSPAMASLGVDNFMRYFETIYSTMLFFLPNVPTENENIAPTEGAFNDQKSSDSVSVRYSELEAVLYVACQFGKYFPQYFGGLSEFDQQSNIVTDGLDRTHFIRPRLQYLSQLVQEYSVSLSNQLSDSEGEKNQLKLMARKLMLNVQSMVRCFFLKPPSFKSLNMSLSWVQPLPLNVNGTKRSAPNTVSANNSKSLRKPWMDRQLSGFNEQRFSRRRRFNRGKFRGRKY